MANGGTCFAVIYSGGIFHKFENQLITHSLPFHLPGFRDVKPKLDAAV